MEKYGMKNVSDFDITMRYKKQNDVLLGLFLLKKIVFF